MWVFLIEPVRPAEVARVHLVRAPRPAEVLLMALDLVERGEQRPGLRRAAVLDEPHHAVATAAVGLERKDRFDSLRAAARHRAWWGAVLSDPKTLRTGTGRPLLQCAHHHVATAERLDRPGEREHVAPMAIRREQGSRARVVGRGKRLLEIGKPVLDHGRGDVVLGQHSPTPTETSRPRRSSECRAIRSCRDDDRLPCSRGHPRR